MTFPFPSNEALRLEVVRRLDVLDSAPEERFDRISRLTARIFHVPVALVSLVDENRQWFKSCYGLELRETDRNLAFCAYTIVGEDVFVVEDTLKDPRFCNSPLVTSTPFIRFYAGAPLLTKEGVAVGALCIIDSVPRQFSPADRASLEDLAALVVDELELREKNSLMAEEIARRDAAELCLKQAQAEVRLKSGALARNQQRLDGILANAPAVIYVKDLEGRYLVVNRAFEQLVQKPEEEVLGRSDADFFPARIATEFGVNDATIRGTGKAMEFEETVAVDGVDFVFRSVKFPLRDEHGEIYATCGISSDITEQTRAQRALRESGARKNAILESSLDAIITIDHLGVVLEANSAAERIFGYRIEEMIGRDMAELIVPPRHREGHQRGMSRLIATGNSAVLGQLLELPAVRSDGTEFPIEIAITRIPLDGNPMFTGHIRDITARKAAERALQDSQLRYERMAANMPGMVYQFVLQPDGSSYFTFVSQGCREIAGMEAAYLLENPDNWINCVHPEDRDSLHSSILESAKSLEPWSWEGRVLRSDSGTVWVKGMARPTLKPNGDVHWDGFIFDITERKNSENVLRESRDEAQRANRAKSEFLSRMSHELRTPLNAILGFGQLLERATLTPRHKDSVAQIIRAGRHLLELINEILDLSRIEAGRMSFSPEAVNATELVRETLSLVRPLSTERGIQLLGVMAGDHWVTADRQKLRQVLLNLISNAVKYNKLGGVVEVRFIECPSRRLDIAITDTGFGLAPEKLEKAFVPFERLGAEQSGIEGCGIGLALSKRLIEMMGGTLRVESRVGHGSTFTVHLPCAVEPTVPAGALMTLNSGMVSSCSTEKRRRVLYVEDNPANLRLMSRILEERGDIELSSCERGDEAIRAVQGFRPELILLDLHLPGMDGESVLKAVRTLPESQDVPVIMISADAMPSQINRLLSSGANEYLTKPIHVGDTLRLLGKYLD